VVLKRRLQLSRIAIARQKGATIMRTMIIPPFPKCIEISDIQSTTNARFAEKFSLSEQAAMLAAYMLHPASEDAQNSFLTAVRSVPDPLRLNLKKMRRIQLGWLRVADIFHLYYDMASGGHQSRRGGATISKAVHLAAKNTASLGTSEPTLWNIWTAYKDVAPLINAAVLIWANARIVFTGEYIAAFRVHDDAEPITLDQLSPFHVVMLMPELVLAVGQSFEEFALRRTSGRIDAGLDPERLWRIPADINVIPVTPPARDIRSEDLLVLNARRAGNRGRCNKAPSELPISTPL
jgi:hypothetical protein